MTAQLCGGSARLNILLWHADAFHTDDGPRVAMLLKNYSGTQMDVTQPVDGPRGNPAGGRGPVDPARWSLNGRSG